MSVQSNLYDDDAAKLEAAIIRRETELESIVNEYTPECVALFKEVLKSKKYVRYASTISFDYSCSSSILDDGLMNLINIIDPEFHNILTTYRTGWNRMGLMYERYKESMDDRELLDFIFDMNGLWQNYEWKHKNESLYIKPVFFNMLLRISRQKFNAFRQQYIAD